MIELGERHPDMHDSQQNPTGSGPVRRDIYRDVKVHLRDLIGELAAAGERRLPSEDELARRLTVSRPTVRSALLSLQKEGLLRRSHGRGTGINCHAVAARTNLADDRPFVDIIADLGYQPAISVCGRSVEPCTADIARRLTCAEDASMLVLERLYTGDGTPIVFAVDHVPVELVDDIEAPVEQSVFDFLDVHTGHHVHYSVAEIIPIVADAVVAGRLGVTPGSPVILLLHTHIDDRDEPVAVTHAYVRADLMPFSVVRTYRDV